MHGENWVVVMVIQGAEVWLRRLVPGRASRDGAKRREFSNVARKTLRCERIE